jgi:hypothetical protein
MSEMTDTDTIEGLLDEALLERYIEGSLSQESANQVEHELRGAPDWLWRAQLHALKRLEPGRATRFLCQELEREIAQAPTLIQCFLGEVEAIVEGVAHLTLRDETTDEIFELEYAAPALESRGIGVGEGLRVTLERRNLRTRVVFEKLPRRIVFPEQRARLKEKLEHAFADFGEDDD